MAEDKETDIGSDTDLAEVVELPRRKGALLKIRLSPGARASLEEIHKLSGAERYTEIIRQALRFYRWLLEKERDGYTITMTKPENAEPRLVKLDFE